MNVLILSLVFGLSQSAPERVSEPTEPSPAFRIAVEAGAGLGLGLLTAGALGAGGCALEMAYNPDTWCVMPLVIGIPVGLWLGNAFGVFAASRFFDQPGSVLWPLAGSFVGTTFGIVALFLLGSHPVGIALCAFLAVGGTVGAMEFGASSAAETSVESSRVPDPRSAVIPVAFSWRF